MKVTIKDSQILKTVNPDVLQAHLLATGWHETGRIYNDAGAIWRLKRMPLLNMKSCYLSNIT